MIFMLTLGIPKEIKPGEGRVGLTPSGVCRLARKGIPILVERSAGLGSGFSDKAYLGAGAKIVTDSRMLWLRADLIKKVKEPLPQEFGSFREGQIIFTFLHLASAENRRLVLALLKSKVTAIAYEAVRRDGELSILNPMSEIAGILSAYIAGLIRSYVRVVKNDVSCLVQFETELQKLIKGFPRVPKGLSPGRAVVLGGGHVGGQAARMLSRMGGKVVLTEKNVDRLKKLQLAFSKGKLKIHVFAPDDKKIKSSLEQSQVIIGAVYVHGMRSPLIIPENLLGEISRQHKKIILDVAIDQGGNIALSRPTTYQAPIYVDRFGNIRVAISNIPSLCARKASQWIEKTTLNYTFALAHGLEFSFNKFPELLAAIQLHRGCLSIPSIAESHRLPYSKN